MKDKKAIKILVGMTQDMGGTVAFLAGEVDTRDVVIEAQCNTITEGAEALSVLRKENVELREIVISRDALLVHATDEIAVLKANLEVVGESERITEAELKNENEYLRRTARELQTELDRLRRVDEVKP